MLSLRLSKSFQQGFCSFLFTYFSYTSNIHFTSHAVSFNNVSSLPCCFISLGKDDSRDSITTETERRRHQKRNERQAGSGSSFANRDDSEKEMESLPYGTDIVEIKGAPTFSCINSYTSCPPRHLRGGLINCFNYSRNYLMIPRSSGFIN